MIQSGILEMNSAKQVETRKSLAETSKWNVASVFLAWLKWNGVICCTKCILGEMATSPFFPLWISDIVFK